MTHYLFRAHIHHFLFKVTKTHGLSPLNGHLFILDRYGSHVTLEVIKLAMEGLVLLIFPSHTSHTLQPLDISCFKPF